MVACGFRGYPPIHFIIFFDAERICFDFDSWGWFEGDVMLEGIVSLLQFDFQECGLPGIQGIVAEPEVELDDDQNDRDDHDQQRFEIESDVFEVGQENFSLGFEGNAHAVLVQPDFQEMSLDPVLDLLDSLLVGGVAVDQKHENGSQEGDHDHSHPRIHVPEGDEQDFEYLS
jgi:hypothetical protein